MAHSIQLVGDTVGQFHDLDLIALVGLANVELESSPEDYRAIAPSVAGWRRDLAGYGPGCIDLKLDEIASSPVMRSELALVLARVDEELRGLGEIVPAHVLNARCGMPGVVFFDYRVSALPTAIAQLQALIASAV